MSTTTTEKRSLKDRFVAHLPGHKNRPETRNNGLVGTTTRTTTLNRTGTLTNMRSTVPILDRNANGIPDSMERRAPLGTDLNRNGIPDSLERNQTLTQAPLATDLNRNGIPDQLEGSRIRSATDLNGNGIPDSLERTSSVGMVGGMNDLNRNGIPDNLERQGSFGFIGSVPTSTASIVDVREAPVETVVVEKPAIVHEVIKTEETVQIQPIIERERDQTDVYEIIQPIKEVDVMPTVVSEVTLPAQIRPTVMVDGYSASSSIPAADTTISEQRSVLEKAPIIREKRVHRIVEEIFPVIYREVPASMAQQFINRAIAEAEIERTTTTKVGAAQLVSEEMRIGQLTGNLQGMSIADVEAYVREQIRTGNYTETTTVSKSVEHVAMATQTMGSQTVTNVTSSTY